MKKLILRVGTYNLFKGGLDGDGPDPAHRDDSRLQQQIALLSGLNLDVIGLQEATWGASGEDRAAHIASELGMSYAYLGRSNFYGCHLAALVRAGDDITVTHTEHLTGPPFVHALLNVTLEIAGHPNPVHFLVGHCAPSSPSVRLAEAEVATVHRHQDVIYVADFNAAALTDHPDVTGIDPAKAANKLDTRPALALASAGLIDVGALLNGRTPTVGHADDKLAYRADRIHTNLPADLISGYGVELGGDDLSDHRPTWAELTFGT